MKNLKKLLAVIVSICVLATFTVPAFAAETVKTDAEICADLGVLKGENSGVTTEYLALGTTRLQAAILYLRLIGKEAEALAFTGTETFDDADEVTWAGGKAILAYLKANPSLGWQGDGTNFDPNSQTTAQELYKVMLTAMGYVQGTDFEYANTIAFAAEKGLKLKAADGAISNDDTATILVEALKANLKDGTKTLAAKLVEAGIISKAAAVAADLYSEIVKAASIAGAGAKKLLVTFNAAVADTSKMVLSVKRDGITVNIVAASTTWNEAKTQATLTASYLIQDGKYVVTAKYDTQDATTATADIEAAEVSKITFMSNNAIITPKSTTAGDEKKAIKTTLKFENQYGEDVTDDIDASDVSVTASKGDGSAATLVDGILTIKDTADYVVDNTVVVTVVHKTPSVVASKTLAIAQTAEVASITLGEVTTDYEEYKDEPIYLANDMTEYYIPVTLKDQYGNVLSVNDVAGMIILSSDPNIVNPATVLTEDDDDNIIIELQDQVATEASGTAVVTVVSPSGKSASTSIVVLANSKIDTLTLSQPDNVLKEGVESVIPFTAIDQFGKALVTASELPMTGVTNGTKLTFNDVDGTASDTQITVTNATIRYGVNTNNERTIKITPTSTDSTVVMTVITATAKVQTLTMSVEDKPEPVAISSISSSFYKAMQTGTELQTFKETYVNLIDQYGEDIDLPSGWTIKVEANDKTFSNVELAPTVVAPATYTTVSSLTFAPGNTGTFKTIAQGTETIKLTLAEGATIVDESTFGIQVVGPEDLDGYTIADITTPLYTGTATSVSHDKTLTMYGLIGTTKVWVPQTDIVAANVNVAGITTEVSTLSPYKTSIKSSAKTTDGDDEAAKLTVIVQGYSDTYTITKDFVYNDAVPEAKTIYFYNSSASAITDTVVTKAITDGMDIKGPFTPTKPLYVYITDQYGCQLQNTATTATDANAISDYYSVKLIATNELKADGKSGDVIASIDNLGVITAGADFADGASFTLTVVTPNGLTKSIKIFVSVP